MAVEQIKLDRKPLKKAQQLMYHLTQAAWIEVDMTGKSYPRVLNALVQSLHRDDLFAAGSEAESRERDEPDRDDQEAHDQYPMDERAGIPNPGE